ncbi:MAG: hypothetical protein J2P45_11675 [Candidatus Dormibacteraeota bacterium]|nr:hypothetical protein [Candidatus Dormibacteraeota bacterium]
MGVTGTRPRERASFFTRACDSLAATSDPAVMESCSRTDLDLECLLLTRSTLYVVSPSQHQRRVSPLIAAPLESIIITAYDLHHPGRLEGRQPSCSAGGQARTKRAQSHPCRGCRSGGRAVTTCQEALEAWLREPLPADQRERAMEKAEEKVAAEGKAEAACRMTLEVQEAHGRELAAREEAGLEVERDAEAER